MIIILEGPDGSGKTSLANQISRQTGYPILHRTKPKDEAEKQRMMEEYLQIIRSGKNMIFDRCWYSEMAYGPVMRDKSYITFPQMYDLEQRLAKTGAIIIYCTGPAYVLWKRCQSRGEDYITSKGNFDAICKNFEEIFASPHYIPVVRHEYKDM
jgi:thymidylate kinase